MAVDPTVRAKLLDAPNRPGCYLMRDRRGVIVYVGKAASIRKRLQSYFRGSAYAKAPPKLRGLLNSAADIEWIVTRNEDEAFLTESRLIREFRPRYNVALTDDKRYPLLSVDHGAPYPRMRVARLKPADGAQTFGPYVNSTAARMTLDFIEKEYGLRRCAPRIPDDETHRHCIDDIVRFCSAPCIGRVSREEYAERVREACAFLRGERPAVIEKLRAAMREEAGALNFEKAAQWRDIVAALEQTIRRPSWLGDRRPRTRDDGDDEAGVRALGEALDLARPPRIVEAFDISLISGTFAVAGMVVSVNGRPRPNRYRRFRIKTVEGANDPAMIAEAVRRRYSRALDEAAALPDLVLLDGGITQLKAARRELDALGLTALPAVGLAKEHEQIHRIGAPRIKLDSHSPALHALQRLRDEAHRFALTYHRALRQRRIRESRLDDIPGVGAAKKNALLRHFGSFSAIASAAPDTLAAAPGIGAALAASIYETLHAADSPAAAPPRVEGNA